MSDLGNLSLTDPAFWEQVYAAVSRTRPDDFVVVKDFAKRLEIMMAWRLQLAEADEVFRDVYATRMTVLPFNPSRMKRLAQWATATQLEDDDETAETLESGDVMETRTLRFVIDGTVVVYERKTSVQLRHGVELPFDRTETLAVGDDTITETASKPLQQTVVFDGQTAEKRLLWLVVLDVVDALCPHAVFHEYGRNGFLPKEELPFPDDDSGADPVPDASRHDDDAMQEDAVPCCC